MTGCSCVFTELGTKTCFWHEVQLRTDRARSVRTIVTTDEDLAYDPPVAWLVTLCAPWTA